MKGGKRNGYGVNLWANGDKHEGYWVENLAHGQGKFYFNNGAFYDGNWVGNKA